MALRELLAKFDIEVDSKKLESADKGIDGLSKKLSEFAAAITGAAVVNGIKNFVTGLTDTADQIVDTSNRLGIGTDELQRFQLAAKLSGAEAGDLSSSLQKFQLKIAEASQGGAAGKAAFDAVGVSVKGANGEIGSATDLMKGVAEGLMGIQDPALRTQAAVDLLGKSGTKLLPMLEGGAAGLDDLLGELDRLGGGFSKEALETMGALGDQTDRYEASLNSLKGQVAIAILPPLTKLLTGFTNMVAAVSKNADAATHLKNALGVLGAVGAAAGLRMAAPYLGFAVLVAAAVLIVDDLITGLQGGDSITGRFLDRILGKGSGASIFKSIRDDWNDFYKDVKGKDLGSAIEEMFSRVGASITQFFVQDIPEAVALATENTEKGVASTGEKVVAALNKALNPVAWAKNAYKLFSELGERLIDGLVEGFKSGVDKAEKAAGEVIDKIKNKFTISFEVKSPSRWMQRFAGNVFSPLATEPAAWAPKVVAAVDNMANMIKSPMARITSPASNRFASLQANNTFHVNSTGGVAGLREGVLGATEAANRAALESLREIV